MRRIFERDFTFFFSDSWGLRCTQTKSIVSPFLSLSLSSGSLFAVANLSLFQSEHSALERLFGFLYSTGSWKSTNGEIDFTKLFSGLFIHVLFETV